MFENLMNPFNHRHILEDSSRDKNQYVQRYHAAVNCFWSTWRKGLVFRLFAGLLRHRTFLYDLSDVKPALKLHGSHYAGIQLVRIDAILGTEGKASDFDRCFHPRDEASRERWVNMAMEYLCCYSLPPVQLTQIGDAYFVRDGHHRISVARAFGQSSIDAEVVIWNVSTPLPWQPGASFESTTVLQRAGLSV